MWKFACGVTLSAFLVACAAPDLAASPPSANDVFQRYLDHRGGQAALQGLDVVERTGVISLDTGPGGQVSGTYHTCVRYPDRGAVEIDAGPVRIAQALRVDGAFECQPGFTVCQPTSTQTAAALQDTARNANKELLDRAADWRAGAVSASEDAAAWRITLEDGNWAEFDRADGALRTLGRPDRWRRLGQWREVSGVSFPHLIEDFAVNANGESQLRSAVQLSEVRISETPSPWCVERFGNN